VSCLKDDILAVYPDKIISLKDLEGLDYIEAEGGTIKIGAMTTLADIVESKEINEACKVLASAAQSVASPNIRNTATIGGNICQDTRCWYYRYPASIGGKVDCARKTGEICYAMMGENRFHSIFGSAEVNTSACTNACPAHTKISAYLAELREGKIEEAARIILDVNPMPFITSPVCAHFCQESCGRGTFDEGVNIGAIERYMGDYILENREKFYAPPEKENGKKIAILGSGPAGLTAAYFLRKEGYAVTLFERMEEAGGCLAYAIPAYRLPKEVVKDFIGILKNMGIDFRLNELVGEDGISLESLYEGYDSVMLDTGTWKRPLIGISGEEMTKFGLDFLVDVNNYIHDKPGANVVVVGGGNVAADVAITAKRLGAPKVSMVCLESREEMPANNEEVERVLEEGVELHNGWGPKDVIKGDEGVSGIEFKHCKQVFDQGGKFAPQYEEDNLMNIEADVILMAIGQIAELDFLKGSFPVETERGRIKAIDGNKTNIPGLFAAGDVTT
ncbi:MAG: FAD-dependent oxidoreductase, partial [Anaerovoracaceae bacterium]